MIRLPATFISTCRGLGWLALFALLPFGALLPAAEEPAPPSPPPPAEATPPPAAPADSAPPEPDTALPDAVPPGEPEPWGPPATPPAENSLLPIPLPLPPPAASDPVPAPAPAPVTANPAAPAASAIPADNPDDQPLDLPFLDFLVPKHPRPTWRFGGAMEIAGTAEIDETRATVGTQAVETFVGYKEWRLRYKRNFFDWDLHGTGVFPSFPTALGGGNRDPWQDLNTVGLAWFHFGRWKPQWFYIYSAGANATFEKEVKDCFAGFGMASLVYQPDKHWKFNFGVLLAINRVHVLPLPMVGFTYGAESADGWFIKIGFPELLIGYRFNDQFMLSTKFIEGGGETWRLADHNPVAHGGYLETKEAKTGIDAEWKPNTHWTVTFAVKYLFSRQWTVRSSTLKHKQTINLDNALSSQCQVEYAF